MHQEAIDVSDLADHFIMKETKYVRALKQLQVGRIREEIKMYQKIHQIMFEHHEKLAAFDKKRETIINGKYEPTEEECKYEFADESVEVEATDEKGIPDFWLTIFSNLDLFNANVSDLDSDILKHLKNIRYDILDDPQGFKLYFEFEENEYFSNTVLTKTYYYSDKIDPVEPLTHTQLMIARTEGCKIDWKSADKNVTEKNGEKQDTFFNFFDPPTGLYAEVSDDEKDILQADFEMGETLYSSIIPRAIVYYTGEGIDEDYDDGEFDEDEEYDEEEEDHPKVLRSARRRGNTSGQQPPECKNQ